MPKQTLNNKGFILTRGITLNSGFTLIELLLAVSIIGILSGIIITIINPQGTQDKAKDAVKFGNVAKVAQAVSAFQAAEGRYPTSTTEDAFLPYVKNWPSDEYVYNTFTEGGKDFACVGVLMEQEVPGGNFDASLQYIKWVSEYDENYTGGEEDMGGKVVRGCNYPNRCQAGSAGNSLDTCTL